MDDSGVSSGYGRAGSLYSCEALKRSAARVGNASEISHTDSINSAVSRVFRGITACVEGLLWAREKGGVAFELGHGDRRSLSHYVHIFYLRTRTKPVSPANPSLQCS